MPTGHVAAMVTAGSLLAVLACGASRSADQPASGGPDGGAGADVEAGPMLGMTGDSGSCLPASPDAVGCSCTAGEARPCYTGPAATRSVGVCHDGSQACQMDGEFLRYGSCAGDTLPGTERGHCTDGLDNDCNGLTDCKDPACSTDPACATTPDAQSPVDGSVGDTGVPPDAGDAGPCPTSPLSRTVGAHRSSLPAMTWWGGGYTVIIDEVVSEQPFVCQLTFEKTDETGARIAGPTAITPNDGTSRYWPRVAFSGTQYGITYDEGGTMTFLRTDASLVPIAGSKVALGSTSAITGSTFGTAAVAWSNQTWGVVWSVSTSAPTSTLSFQRFDATGASLAPAMTLGTTGLSDNGVPMIATSAGWAVIGSGTPAVLYEIDAQGTVRTVMLPFDALRASLASDGTEYGIVADAMNPIEGNAMFARVQIGGAVVAGSIATLGTSQASLPNVIWTSQGFVTAWSETYASAPQPLKTATIPPGSTTTAFPGTAFSAQNNAGFNQLAAGSCGWGVVYGTFTANLFDFLDVQP